MVCKLIKKVAAKVAGKKTAKTAEKTSAVKPETTCTKKACCKKAEPVKTCAKKACCKQTVEAKIENVETTKDDYDETKYIEKYKAL